MGKAAQKSNRVFVNKSIPYRYCYEEYGMIEVEDGVYTRCYRIVKPDGEVKGNYNSKATRMYMEKILVSLLEKFSFEFTIRNCHKDMEKYLSEIEIDELDDAYTHLRKQYNKVLKENSGIGHNNL